MYYALFRSHAGGLHDPEGPPSAAARLLLDGGRMVPIKIRSLGEFFDIKFWCYQKKKNRKKLQKLVLRFGTTGKKFGPKIFGGRPQVVVFSIPRDFVLEKFRVFWGGVVFRQKSKKIAFSDFRFWAPKGFVSGLDGSWCLFGHYMGCLCSV